VRVGINFGNALLATRDAGGAPRGIALDLALELTRRLGVPMELVAYDSAGRMADGAQAGAWDVAFLAADPERAEEIVFTEPYLEVPTTYLVWEDSTIATLADVDRDGVRVSVSNKSAYDLFLTRALKHARLVRASTPPASIHLFFEQKLDALAALKPLLLDIQESHAGTRVLDGSFMTVRQAIGVPKARAGEIGQIHEFIAGIKASGLVAQVMEKNGVRGASVAP
jgi:polar amino acid transport system substrate-binding protein